MSAERHSQLPPGHQNPPRLPLTGQGAQSGHAVGSNLASTSLGTQAFRKRPLDHADADPKRQTRRRAASDDDAAYMARLLCVWPETVAELRTRLEAPLRYVWPEPVRALALCHTLTLKDLRARTWRGVRQTIYNRVNTADFLAWWCRTSHLPSENLTDSIVFPWGRYLMGMANQEAVVGNKASVIKFYVADVPGVADPCNPGDSLSVFIALRADGSQVRIQPHRDQSALLLYLDRPGPSYHGHLARTKPWPPGYWGTIEEESQCLLCPRSGPERSSCADIDVIATADGMIHLHDIMTTLEAQSALLSLELRQDEELDLSSGDRFPWVLWVHHQPEIMQIIRDSSGVTYFSAVDFSFMREETLVKAQAFQLELQDGPSLALIPVGGDLTIAPMTRHAIKFTCECKWLLNHLGA